MLRGTGIGVLFPGEEGTKIEMLHYRELGENFSIEHLDHSLLSS